MGRKWNEMNGGEIRREESGREENQREENEGEGVCEKKIQYSTFCNIYQLKHQIIIAIKINEKIKE